MTAPARARKYRTFTLIESEIVAVSVDTILDGIDTSKPHCFVAAQFFGDAEGTTVVTPTAGLLVINIQTVNNTPVFEKIETVTITASSPVTLDWSANTKAVRALVAGIATATHYRLVVTCNET